MLLITNFNKYSPGAGAGDARFMGMTQGCHIQAIAAVRSLR